MSTCRSFIIRESLTGDGLASAKRRILDVKFLLFGKARALALKDKARLAEARDRAEHIRGISRR